MNRFYKMTHLAGAALLIAVSGIVGTARADDLPSPCTTLKRIVAAGPGGFSTLTPEDGLGIARPGGSDPRCGVAKGSYYCEWTSHGDAGTTSDALESVAADIAACLPDATHDMNSPVRQHFYLGQKGERTEIAVSTVGGGRIRLVVSGR